MNDSTVRLYRIMDPGFSLLGMWMVGLKNANGIYSVFTAKGAHNAEATINCEASLDKELGDRVIAAWEKVLLETRPTTKIPYLGADGAFDYFGLVTRFGTISGKMWVPTKPFKPGWLEQLAAGLADACETGGKPGKDVITALEAIETAK